MSRRRKNNAENRGAVWLDYGNNLPEVRKQKIIVGKGECRYCGKRVGRGIRFHERACNERLGDTEK